MLKYVIALIAGYYVLEVLRHLAKQIRIWDKEEVDLHLGYKCMLWVVILFTCIAWPLMMLRRGSHAQVR